MGDYVVKTQWSRSYDCMTFNACACKMELILILRLPIWFPYALMLLVGQLEGHPGWKNVVLWMGPTRSKEKLLIDIIA